MRLSLMTRADVSAEIMGVRHMLEPVDDLSVNMLLDGDMCHGGFRRGTVPVFFTRFEPDHIAGMDLHDRTALALHTPAP